MSNTPSLLPCPFCGGIPHLKRSTRGDYTSIVCHGECSGPLVMVIPNDRIEEGISAWNRRTPQPAPGLLSEREAFEAAWEKLYGKRPVLWSQMFAEHKMETPAHSQGNYFYAVEQAAWKLWKARAAITAQGGQ